MRSRFHAWLSTATLIAGCAISASPADEVSEADTSSSITTDVCLQTPGASFSYFSPGNLVAQDGAWLVPSNWDGHQALQAHLGASSSSMQIRQWGTAEDFSSPTTPAASCAYPGYTAMWGASNTFEKVCGFKDGAANRILELTQDGDDQDFTPPAGGGVPASCKHEVDLYAEPNLVAGLPQGFTNAGPPLSELTHLQTDVTVQLPYFKQGNLCGPPKLGGPEYSAVNVDYWISNGTDSQSFVYEVTFWDSNENVNPTGAQDNPCVAQGFQPLSPGRVVGDVIANYGQACIKTGDTSWHTYHLDILPRIRQWIETNNNGYSRDLRHWKVSGGYLGSENQGSNALESRYTAWDLAGSCAAQPPSCAGKVVYEYVSPSQRAHFYTMARDDAYMSAQGYGYVGVTGYAFSSQAAGTVPLNRYNNPVAGDHFYTVDRNDAGLAWFGYTFEEVSAYVYSPATTPPAGAIPLYRFYNAAATDHYYTESADPSVWAWLQAAGYSFERIEAYLPGC